MDYRRLCQECRDHVRLCEAGCSGRAVSRFAGRLLLPGRGCLRVSRPRLCRDVFLLYDGRSLAVAVDTLRPLTVRGEEPGLVVRAGLAGLVPAGEQWSEEELGAARVLLEVEGDTRFEAEVEGVLQIKVTDSDNNDVSELLTEAGLCGVATSSSLTHGKLTLCWCCSVFHRFTCNLYITFKADNEQEHLQLVINL